jgi:transmembrane sensor
MKLDKANFDHLLRRYLAGEASEKEIDFLHAYYKAFEQGPELTNQLSAVEKNSLEERISNRLTKDLDALKPIKKTNLTFLKYAAAVLLAMLSISYFIYTNTKIDKPQIGAVVATNSQKTDQIVLKLANGSEVNLTNDGLSKTITEHGATLYSEKQGELNYKNSSSQPSEPAAYNEVTIPFGKQFKITLADGTKVWLNASSSLRFPVAFHPNKRDVYVTGEAYFEVSKDASRPFTVHTKQSEIVVTGTEFNVASHEDRNEVKTTLVEGSVNVNFANQSMKLAPGEESTSNILNQPMSKVEADVEQTIAWKSGYFVFDQPLKEVLNILSRWYGVTIILDKKIANSTVAGKFSNKRSLEQILTYIGKLKDFKVIVKSKTIELKKN